MSGQPGHVGPNVRRHANVIAVAHAAIPLQSAEVSSAQVPTLRRSTVPEDCANVSRDVIVTSSILSDAGAAGSAAGKRSKFGYSNDGSINP